MTPLGISGQLQVQKPHQKGNIRIVEEDVELMFLGEVFLGPLFDGRKVREIELKEDGLLACSLLE